MQRSFDAFLEERGVDAELGEFLMKALEDKEQREYASDSLPCLSTIKTASILSEPLPFLRSARTLVCRIQADWTSLPLGHEFRALLCLCQVF